MAEKSLFEIMLGRFGRRPGFTASEQKQLLELEREEPQTLAAPVPSSPHVQRDKPLTEEEKRAILLHAIQEHRKK